MKIVQPIKLVIQLRGALKQTPLFKRTSAVKMTFGPFGPLQMTFSSPDSAGQQHPHQFPDCMRFCASQTVGSTIVWPQNVRSCQNTIILAQNVPLRKNQNVVSLKAKTLFQHVWVLRSFLALPKTHCTCLGDVVL